MTGQAALEGIRVLDLTNFSSSRVVRTLDQIVKDSQVLAREMIVNIEHPILGQLPLQAS